MSREAGGERAGVAEQSPNSSDDTPGLLLRVIALPSGSH